MITAQNFLKGKSIKYSKSFVAFLKWYSNSSSAKISWAKTSVWFGTRQANKVSMRQLSTDAKFISSRVLNSFF